MQPVRAAARLSGRARIAAAALAAAVAAALVVGVVASGGDTRAPARAAPPAQAAAPAHAATAPEPPVARIGGKALQSARCRHWEHASPGRRDAVVATLARVIGGPTPYGRASTLPPDAAHQLFDRACRRPYARGFLLYELYTRAAAFYRTSHRAL